MKKSISFILVYLILAGLLFGCAREEVSTLEEAIVKPGVLSDFEDVKQWDTYPERGFKLSLSKKYVTEGARSLEVAYPRADYPSINTRRIEQDWEEYDYFCLDVFNPQNETLDFTIRIDDSTGERINIGFPLKKGKNEIKISIPQIARHISTKEIDFVVLFLKYPNKRYTLYFDNMHLEAKGASRKKAQTIQKQEKLDFPMAIWAIDDSVKVRPESAVQRHNYVWNETTKTVTICGAKNEYVAFQLIIKAGSQDISISSIKASDLTGPAVIGKSNIQLFKEHYLEVTQPSSAMYGEVSLGKGEYPDALIPLRAPKDGAPFSIEKGRNQPVWVDVYIPPEALRGLYKGSLVVLSKELEPEVINIFLQVWDFSLPDETHMKSFFYYGPEQIMWVHKLNSVNSYDYQSLEEKYQRMAHQHRLNMCTDVGHYGDWRGFLERAGRYLNGAAFKEGAGRSVGVPLWVIGEAFDTQDKVGFQQACKWYIEHFEKEGWGDKPFLYIIDEPGSKEAYDKVRRIGKWVDEAPEPGNKLAFMLTEQVEPQRPEFGSLVGYVDIWCSGRGFPEEMEKRRKAGDRIWTYNGGPDEASVVIDTYGLACRSWAWTAWRYNIECWFLWDCTYWVDKHNLRGQDMTQTDLWNDALTFDQTRRKPAIQWPDWGNGDGTFFYPGYEKGVDGPIGSFRMKAFRRGMQDYEYLYLLKQLGRQDAADKAASELDYRKNKAPEQWHKMRIKLANEILKGQIDE